MATNILKLPITRVACRGLASQASPAAAAADGPAEGPQISCTVLPNKILVGSLDLHGGLSRVSVVFRTGSRNEGNKNAGSAHAIRSMAGFSTTNFTDFYILRNLQQMGSCLTCTGDREFTSFNLVGTRDNINHVFGFLASVVANPAFKPWQVKRNVPRLKYDLSLLTPQIRTMEMIHKAAFRTGLGNPLFMPKDLVGTHTPEMLREFYNQGFSSNRAAIVGYNVAHKDIVNFAESFSLSGCDPPEGNSTYYGGEIRKEKNTYFATVAIAGQGVGSKDMKEALTYGILQHALGIAPVGRWAGSPSPLYKALSSASQEAGGSCFNISYSDNGLFGIMINSPGQHAALAVQGAFSVLKAGKVSDDDIKRGKSLLKLRLLDSASSSENLLDDMATQSLINGVVVPPTVLAEAIDKITSAEVQLAAKKVASSKFSMAAFGNIADVPYLSDLK
ncbi:UNVERIFIED_CONTAM: hypothetical protein PYX00_008190 [Menopon gallinae]|uniref:Uncharacterized protein n=1 Tax=Menopon gallinae TaxID=328185 RepID=A0AAW2HLS8_9NEOP